MKKTYEPQRKERRKKEEERSEVIGLHATEVHKKEKENKERLSTEVVWLQLWRGSCHVKLLLIVEYRIQGLYDEQHGNLPY